MGQVLGGRYELLDIIGKGGMGTVWRVRDLREDTILAGKVFRQSDAGSLLRFMRETTTRISHPHVIMPLGWAGEDDQIVFSMPLIDGGSVAELIKEHTRLPHLFVAEILRQVLLGLQAVHSAGVIHRDVKPANILLKATGTERPFALLTDFGIAAELEGPRLTRTAMVLGTPGYLAPEVYRGHDPHDQQDLYAAGAVAYCMLTGDRPAENGMFAGLTGPQPQGVPLSLWGIIQDLVAFDVTARATSAAVIIERLAIPELAWRPDAMSGLSVPVRLNVHDAGSKPDGAVGTDNSWSVSATQLASGSQNIAQTVAEPPTPSAADFTKGDPFPDLPQLKTGAMFNPQRPAKAPLDYTAPRPSAMLPMADMPELQAPPAPVSTPKPPQKSRKKLLAIAAGGIGVLVAGGVGYTVLTGISASNTPTPVKPTATTKAKTDKPAIDKPAPGTPTMQQTGSAKANTPCSKRAAGIQVIGKDGKPLTCRETSTGSGKFQWSR